MKLRLSIIIISYNTKQLLQDCLASFYPELPADFEVIVVDNNSTDGSVEFLKKTYPKVKLVENQQNLGYAKANNQGIKIATGKFVLLLNSDTLISVTALEKLLDFGETHPQAGVISPLLRFRDKSIQQNGGSLPNLLNMFFWQFFLDEIPLLTHLVTPYQQEDPEFYLTNRRMGWVSGACFLIPQTVLNKVGFLDEQIFMYAEDIDYCKRVSEAGYQVWSVKSAEIIHIGQGSGKKSRALLGEYQGLCYYFAKHYHNQYSMIRWILIIGAEFRAIFLGKILKRAKAYDTYKQAAQLVRQV